MGRYLVFFGCISKLCMYKNILVFKVDVDIVISVIKIMVIFYVFIFNYDIKNYKIY